MALNVCHLMEVGGTGDVGLDVYLCMCERSSLCVYMYNVHEVPYLENRV
jgi:hypothetical protein